MTGEHEDLSRIIEAKKPHLVLLDLMLPGTDGLELMESVPELADLPVIFISGYGRDETIARALESGAEDYIVKPFSPTELTARVRAALRRREEPEPFVLGDLAIHYEARRVTVAARALELTATEYELLRTLSLNAGRVSTYDMLLRRVWSRRHTGDTGRLRTVMKRLRRKLGDDPARPNWIFSELLAGAVRRHRDRKGRLPHAETRRLVASPRIMCVPARKRDPQRGTAASIAIKDRRHLCHAVSRDAMAAAYTCH